MRQARTLGEGLLAEKQRPTGASKSLGSVDLVASLLSRRQAYGNEQFLALPIWIQHGAGWEQQEALVDSGASLNFISHLLAKELELGADPTPLKRVTTLGGQPLLTYRFRKAILRLADT